MQSLTPFIIALLAPPDVDRFLSRACQSHENVHSDVGERSSVCVCVCVCV